MHSQHINRRQRPRNIALEDRAERICSRTYRDFRQTGPRRSTLLIGFAITIAVVWSVGYRTGASDSSALLGAGQADLFEVVAAPVAQPTVAVAAQVNDSGPAQAADVATEPGLFVQAGAFREAQNAHALQHQLESSGMSKVAVIANLEGVPVYRVHVGPLMNANEQAELIARLTDVGLTGLMLVDASQPEAAQPVVAVTAPVTDPPPVADAADASALFVQAGAFREAQNAHALQRQLEASGVNKVTVIPNLEGVPVYRVYVGPLTNANEQAELIARLTDAGVTGLMLVDATQPEAAPPAVAVAAPVADSDPDRAPVAEAAAESELFVQAGAFREAQNAHALQRELEVSGVNKVAVIPNLEGAPVYRVHVGPLANANEQAELIARLTQAGLTGLMLVDASQPESAQPAVAASIVEPLQVAASDHREAWSGVAVGSNVEITRAGSTRSAATRRLLREGASAMNRGDLGTAEYKFRQVLAAEPDASQASIYLFTVLQEQGRVDAADTVLVAGLETGSDSAPLAKLYARSLLDRGQATLALQVLEAYRPALNEDSEYAALLAALLQKAFRHQDAAQIYEQLLTLDRRAGDWWVGLGIAQDGLGRPGDALYAFQQARGTSRISAALADYTDQRIAELQTYD